MLKALLIDYEKSPIEKLKIHIDEFCPKITVCGMASTMKEARKLIYATIPDLVFVEVDMPEQTGFKIFDFRYENPFETVFTSNLAYNGIKAFQIGASDFILKPIKENEFLLCIDRVKKKIWEKREKQNIKEKEIILNPPGNLIGIPTIEGFEFINIDQIIRCEGLQNCTRLITKNRTDIISSYTIGKFTAILERFQFFAPHKSHLVNLRHIKKYYKEGTLLISDNSHVPVSKRRKSLFLKKMLLFR